MFYSKNFDFIAPEHFRAKNNKIYYETVIKNQTLNKQQHKGDIDSENLKRISTAEKEKNYKINNNRTDEYLEEQEIYEKLCRQNGTKVKSISLND